MSKINGKERMWYNVVNVFLNAVLDKYGVPVCCILLQSVTAVRLKQLKTNELSAVQKRVLCSLLLGDGGVSTITDELLARLLLSTASN
jgi:hypothetical protein